VNSEYEWGVLFFQLLRYTRHAALKHRNPICPKAHKPLGINILYKSSMPIQDVIIDSFTVEAPFSSTNRDNDNSIGTKEKSLGM
jgi:hypothetical protein